MLQAVLKHYGVSAETPFKELPESVVDTILFGSDDTEFYYKSRFSKNTRRYRGNLKVL